MEVLSCDDSGAAGWVDRLCGTCDTKSLTSVWVVTGSGEVDCSRWKLFSRMVSRSGLEVGDVMLMQSMQESSRLYTVERGGHGGI